MRLSTPRAAAYLLAGTLVAGSFAAGFFEPELRAQGGLPELFVRSRPVGVGKELEPLNAYQRTVNLILERSLTAPPSERRLTFAAIRGLLSTLDDPYTRFLDPAEYAEMRQRNLGEFDGIGAELSTETGRDGFVRIQRTIPGGPAQKAGLRAGDSIVQVNGRAVKGLSVDQVVEIIRGRAGTVVRLKIRSAGSRLLKSFTLKRAPVPIEIVHSRMLENGIGYIELDEFNEQTDPMLEAALANLKRHQLKGLVVDLRGNPGGLLEAAIDVSSRFVPPQKAVVVIVEPGQEPDRRTTVGKKYLGGAIPLVVLVNRTSASASEIVSGAIQDNKSGTIVGTTTFGKGLVQTVIPLEYGAACVITTQKYLTPNGRDINRTRDRRGGIEPDVVVEVTEDEFLARKDPQLLKGIELLKSRLGSQPLKPAPARIGASVP